MNTSHRLALALLEDDHKMISYRPRWRKLTRGLATTILLQQIYYRWRGNHEQPFYKFKEPCDHRLYRPDDSWTEELGMSRSEFDTALKRIGYKRSKTRQGPHEFPVEYWTDASRVTYYTIHLENFCQWLDAIYTDIAIKQQSDVMKSEYDIAIKQQSTFSKSSISTLPRDQDSSFTKSTNQTLSNTEKTTKNNNKNFSSQNFHWPQARAWMEELQWQDVARYQQILSEVQAVEPTLQRWDLNKVKTPRGQAVIIHAWQEVQNKG